MPTRDYSFKRYGAYDREAVATVLEPTYRFQSQRGSWGISGMVRFGVGPNYVFFVSFGQKQAEHEFDEAVYTNGIVRWQSQPSQRLTDPTIQNLIAHDHLKHEILLFLRTSTSGPYRFMGFLKYVNHDSERERPVNFHWEILDFDPTLDYKSMMGLRLQASPDNAGDTRSPRLGESRTMVQSLTLQPVPKRNRRATGVPTGEFRRPPVDYEERDRRNRGLGRDGERLVLEHERRYLTQNGRTDLATQVDPVCWTIGDGLGYDIKSFEPESGEEIHIEVKTTTGPAGTPFYMSAPELEYAHNCTAKYRLYRVYRFNAEDEQVPFFVIEGPISEEQLELTPFSYRVRLK